MKPDYEKNDYERALDLLRMASRSLEAFCDLMEPHKDELFYYMDGWCAVHFKDEYDFGQMRDDAYAMGEDADTLEDYINDELPGLDLSYMFHF